MNSVQANDSDASFYEKSSTTMLNNPTNSSGKLYYPASKAGVMRLLDEMQLEFKIDEDGDLVYDLRQHDWHGYIIFSELGSQKTIWNLQVRTQFKTKLEYYKQLIKFTNEWNATQKAPKLAMKSSTKLVLSINYPVQFGFNPQEFKVNVFKRLNRSAVTISEKIQPMIHVSASGKSQAR